MKIVFSNFMMYAFLIIKIYPSCNIEKREIVAGKYINQGEKGVVHFVELKNDNSYLHYYQKDKDSALENIGSWKYDSIKREVRFENWIEFGDRTGKDCRGCSWTVLLKKGELFFSFDLRKEMNFKK